jgi:hypothetical protein
MWSGITKQQIIGMPVNVIVPPGLQQEFAAIVERLHFNEEIQSFETKRVHKNSGELYVSLSISPVKDENGAIIGNPHPALGADAHRRTDSRRKAAPKCLLLSCDLHARGCGAGGDAALSGMQFYNQRGTAEMGILR